MSKAELVSFPVVDVREGVPVRHAVAACARARALRYDCVTWLPRGARMLLPDMDAVTRRWLQRSHSPYVMDLEAIAVALGFPGIWFLNGTYQWGCTAVARDEDGGPWLARTLDWPFPGLGRHLEIARMRGPAGEFINVTWPGYAGALTALAPGRFAAAINQAPLWQAMAAALRPRRERIADMADPLPPARPSVARGVRDLPPFRRGQAPARDGAGGASGDLHAHRMRAWRALCDRANGGRLCQSCRGHVDGQRLAPEHNAMGGAGVRHAPAQELARRGDRAQPCPARGALVLAA